MSAPDGPGVGRASALVEASEALYTHADGLLDDAARYVRLAIDSLESVSRCPWITNGTAKSIAEAGRRLGEFGERHLEALRPALRRSYTGGDE